MKRILQVGCSCVFLTLLLDACSGGSQAPSSSTSELTVKPGSSKPTRVEFSPIDGTALQCVEPDAGIEGTGLHKFTGLVDSIEPDGTIVVDDNSFSAGKAVVYVNGACASLTDLQPGHVVTVATSASTKTPYSTAAAVYSDDDVAGPILSIDLDHDSIDIMGETVRVTPETRLGDAFGPASLATLVPGEQVAVSGHPDASGAIVATRVDRRPNAAGWLASGMVSKLDETPGHFQLNQMPVRYADAVLVDFPSSTIHDGDFVRVQGKTDPAVTAPSCCDGLGIDAAAVERVDHDAPSPTIAISGFVTRWNYSQDFDIEGRGVQSQSSTRYFGPEVSAINEDPSSIWMTAVGTPGTNGVFDAQLLFASTSAEMTVQGPLTAIDRGSHIAYVANVPVEVGAETVLSQGRNGKAVPITFDALVVGSHVLVAGETLPNGHIAALRMEQDAPSTNFYGWSWFSQAQKHQPEVELEIGGTPVRAVTDSATQYFWGHTMDHGCSCGPRTADTFWSENVDPRAFDTFEVLGTWEGDHVHVTALYWLEE